MEVDGLLYTMPDDTELEFTNINSDTSDSTEFVIILSVLADNTFD